MKSLIWNLVPSSYYFGPVALPHISSVPTPISSVPTHQELMHQQIQVSPASVLGQAQVCPSCRSTFQHPTVSQFAYSPCHKFLFLVTSVGRFIKHHLIPLRTAMRRKRKRILVSAALLLKGRQKFTRLTNFYATSFPDPDLFVILLNEIRSLKSIHLYSLVLHCQYYSNYR
eukprot:g516.t1